MEPDIVWNMGTDLGEQIDNLSTWALGNSTQTKVPIPHIHEFAGMVGSGLGAPCLNNTDGCELPFFLRWSCKKVAACFSVYLARASISAGRRRTSSHL